MMKEKRVRKLAVFSDNEKIIGMIYHHTISNQIRKSVNTSKPTNYSIKAILWNLGSVLQFAGVLMLIPSVMATVLNETVVASGIFLMTTLLLICGFFMNSYGDKYPLSLRGTAIMVFASFFILVLFGTIPYLYVSPYQTESPVELFANSFFSSSAAFTTAGITLFDTPEELPQSFTFFRSFTQFVGGMSFIYLIMTAFYPENKLATMRGFISGKLSKLRDLFSTIMIIFSIYVVIIAVLLFYFGERNIIDNFSVAMSTLSTGGFMPDSTIIPTLTTPEYFVLMAGMLLGALPFGFHYAFVRTKFLSINLTKEVGIYLLVLVAGITMFILMTDVPAIQAAFTVMASSTTAGIQIIDFHGMYWAPKLLIFFMMIIGGCGFSTAGGLKIFRLIRLYEVKKLFKKKSEAEAWKLGQKRHFCCHNIADTLSYCSNTCCRTSAQFGL